MGKAKVVVVEDDPDLLEALVRQFRSDGFDVFSGRNGREGVSRVLQVRPDLIVLDLLMPEMNGHEMMRELLRNREWVREIPVVVLTNYAPIDQKVEGWLQRMSTAYVIKSEMGLDEIVGRAKELLLQVKNGVY